MPTRQSRLHPAIAKYLEELEIAAKQCVGVVPNQILRDAQEHLMRDCEALLCAEPGLTDAALLDHFRESYGRPDEVASSYEQFSETVPSIIPAIAPNWRIHCTRCGRSAPAAKVGITRIGARSIGKKVLGRCNGCKRLRWLSLTRDLNVSGTVSADEQADAPTAGNARSMRSLLSVGAIVVLGTLLVSLPLDIVLFHQVTQTLTQMSQRSTNTGNSTWLLAPADDWRVVSESKIKPEQLEQFSKKFGMPLKELRNTIVRRENQQLQFNTSTTESIADAERLKALLRKGKSNPRWVTSNGPVVFEFVVRTSADARLAAAVRYALPIEPAQRTYSVAFDAVPIKSEKSDQAPDARNRLFNALLQAATQPALADEIKSLSSGFTFADNLRLVKDLQGAVVTTWKSSSATVLPSANDSEASELRVSDAKMRLGLPSTSLSAHVIINTNVQRQVGKDFDRTSLLASTSRFPSESPDIRQAVQKIVAPTDSDAIKLRKLLDWFADSTNMRYDGLTGSRYGTLVAFKQHYGRCWDFSDLFITMARAAGLPARQVYGWLYESEGHVWCDCVVDGRWQMVDPTTGTVCGSDYLPFCVSSEGEFPLLYASPVSITAQ